MATDKRHIDKSVRHTKHFRTTNIFVGTRLRSKGRQLSDAVVLSIRQNLGFNFYMVETFVWRNKLNLTLKELREFFCEAVTSKEDIQNPKQYVLHRHANL